uniref:Uncharacterized protein n=1 Tax=Cannabis sativa TaxID=3483 RepID=A0A803PLT3_CANSA
MIDDEERKDACFGGSISREWKPKLLILILLTHCLLIKEESFGLEAWAQMEMQQKNNLAARQLFEVTISYL